MKNNKNKLVVAVICIIMGGSLYAEGLTDTEQREVTLALKELRSIKLQTDQERKKADGLVKKLKELSEKEQKLESIVSVWSKVLSTARGETVPVADKKNETVDKKSEEQAPGVDYKEQFEQELEQLNQKSMWAEGSQAERGALLYKNVQTIARLVKDNPEEIDKYVSRSLLAGQLYQTDKDQRDTKEGMIEKIEALVADFKKNESAVGPEVNSETQSEVQPESQSESQPETAEQSEASENTEQS